MFFTLTFITRYLTFVKENENVLLLGLVSLAGRRVEGDLP